MEKNENALIKHFFSFGIEPETQKEIIEKKLKVLPDKVFPKILSSYSLEGEEVIFSLIRKDIENEDNLIHYIFPMKTNYLDELKTADYDERKGKFKKVYTDYIIYAENNSKIFDGFYWDFNYYFFHYFKYRLTLDNGTEIFLFFGVLIFFEEVHTYEKTKKKDKKEKPMNLFLGKALVLVSEKPIFYFMEKILKEIHSEFYAKPQTTSKLLELYLSELFVLLNQNINNIFFEEDSLKHINKCTYGPLIGQILPFCDLNIRYFFDIFSLEDIFIFAEYFFYSKSILIVSPNIELLYPIYHLLTNFYFPLNVSRPEYYYNLINPNTFVTSFAGNLGIFSLLYTDKNKDKGFINDKIIELIVKNKFDIMIFQIKKVFEKDKWKIETKKNIYLFDENTKKINIIPFEKMKNNTLIEKYKKNARFSNFFQSIKNEISEIKKNKIIKQSFLDIPIELKSYDILRKNFLGLISNFLVANIKPIRLEINDKNKMTILLLELDEKKKDLNKNNILLQKYQDFLKSDQSNRIYKREIIDNQTFNFSLIKEQILIDYFIYLSQYDPDMFFFDKNKNENEFEINNEKDEGYIEFSVLLENIKLLVNDKERQEKKNDLRKKSIIKNDKILSNKKLKMNLNKFTKYLSIIIKNFNDPFASQNSNNYKYYYLILYEAKMFKKLTRIIFSDNTEQYAACTIGLFISLYIINILKKIKGDEEKEEIIFNHVDDLYGKLIKLFLKTQCFYGKANFIIILMYLILSIHKPLFDKYFENFYLILQGIGKPPSIIIFILYNNNISFDIYNKGSEEEVKKIKLTKLEKIKHDHNFIIDNDSEFYYCENEPICQEYLNYEVCDNITNKEYTTRVYNPIQFLDEILFIIENNNSLICSKFNQIEDIVQIAIYDDLYYNCGFFRDKGFNIFRSISKDI